MTLLGHDKFKDLLSQFKKTTFKEFITEGGYNNKNFINN